MDDVAGTSAQQMWQPESGQEEIDASGSPSAASATGDVYARLLGKAGSGGVVS